MAGREGENESVIEKTWKSTSESVIEKKWKSTAHTYDHFLCYLPRMTKIELFARCVTLVFLRRGYVMFYHSPASQSHLLAPLNSLHRRPATLALSAFLHRYSFERTCRRYLWLHRQGIPSLTRRRLLLRSRTYLVRITALSCIIYGFRSTCADSHNTNYGVLSLAPNVASDI
jgi:hypothetical protein